MSVQLDNNQKSTVSLIVNAASRLKGYFDALILNIDTALATKVTKTTNQALSAAADALTISGSTITLARGDGTTDTVVVPTSPGTWRGISDSISSTSSVISASSTAVKAAYDRSWPNTTYSVGDGGLTQVNFTTADNTKLDGIEAGATADQTAAEILASLKTVDGSGSGLDADLLDGQSGAYYRNATNLNAGTINDARLPNSISSNITGNAATATKLATARTISLSGDVTGSTTFNGSGNATITAVVADDSHNHTIANVDGLQTALDGKADKSVVDDHTLQLSELQTAKFGFADKFEIV